MYLSYSRHRCLWTCLSYMQQAMLSLAVSVLHKTVLPLHVSVLQPLLPLDVYFLHQSVLSLGVSVCLFTSSHRLFQEVSGLQQLVLLDVQEVCGTQQPLLHLNVSACMSHCAPWTCLSTRACASPVYVCLQELCAAPGHFCLKEPMLNLELFGTHYICSVCFETSLCFLRLF
jgi:hypothetical protein